MSLSTFRLCHVPFPRLCDLVSLGGILQLKMWLLPPEGREMKISILVVGFILIASVITMHATLCRRCSSVPIEATSILL